LNQDLVSFLIWPALENLLQPERESLLVLMTKEISMSDKKRVRHTPQQIVEKLQQADRLLNAGQSVGQVLQALGVIHIQDIPLGRHSLTAQLR